ncbi:MAG TPA: TrkH family potassium uptake protein [Clostridiales bacterium]|nr:TrkH family potassium uptake protein [Clostridiales bacterium]
MIRINCVLNALGKILLIVGAALLLPTVWSLFETETNTAAFLTTILICLISGSVLVYSTKGRRSIRAKEGFLIVTLSWITVSLIGAVPYYINGIFPDFTSAFFESISGFTTTGASNLVDVEAVPTSFLIWRSATHWLGGLGVIVLFVAILSQADTGGLTMLRAELSGPFNEKISSKVQDSAIYLWLTYTALTAICLILLLFGGLKFSDALCLSFSTIATGGFATLNDSIGGFNSVYVEWVVTAFMFIGGISIPLMYKSFVSRSPKMLVKNEEFRLYFFFIFILIVTVTVDLLLHTEESFRDGLRLAAFQSVSQLTTTGFCTDNFDLWPTASYTTLICIMLIGASYSSTSGSIKMGTYLVAYKSLKAQFFKMLHPRAMVEVRVNGKAVTDNTVMRVLQFAFLFFILMLIGAVALSLTGLPFKEAVTGSMAAMSNNGPGSGMIGPAGNYASVSPAGKWILCALMLLGRLEIYTVMIVFTPAFWRR